MKTITRGARKVAFGAVGLAFLLAGLCLCLRYPDAGKVLFVSYATAVVTTVTAVVVGNVGEHLAARGKDVP